MNKISDDLEYLKLQGFNIPYYSTMIGKNLSFLEALLKDRKTNSEYLLDGLVISINDETNIQKLPTSQSSSINPNYSKKFKVNTDENRAITKVVKVWYNISKDNYYIPRIEVEPVELSGVTVTFTSGFNCKYIDENNIGSGTIVQLTRSGEVIPYIEKIILSTTAELPETKNTIWEGVHLKLDEYSEEANLQKIIDTFSILGVDNFGEGIAKKMVESGITSDLELLKASEETWTNIVGVNGSKIYASLKKQLESVQPYILYAASQLMGRGIGRRKLKKLYEKYKSNNFDLTISQILDTDGFSDKTAELVYSNLPKAREWVDSLHGYYSFAPTERQTEMTGKKINVVFTGIRDKELEHVITSKYNGNIGSTISKNTDYLVVKEMSSTSSKMVKANELGVRIISIGEAKNLWTNI